MKKRLMLVVAFMALAGVLATALGCAASGGDSGSPQGVPYAYAAEGRYSLADFNTQQQVGLWVSGQGKATAVPDIAVVDVGVQAQADNVSQGMALARDAMNQIMAALSSNGVLGKDIQTRYFNISPIWRYNEWRKTNEIVGYQMDNSVTAKIRNIEDTERVGRIIDAVAEAGGDLTRIGSLYFTIEDPKPYQREARAEAMEDAIARARQMAELAGVGLGKPIYITEGAASIPTPRVVYFKGAEAMVAPEPPTPFSAGEQEITVSVQMVFDIV